MTYMKRPCLEQNLSPTSQPLEENFNPQTKEYFLYCRSEMPLVPNQLKSPLSLPGIKYTKSREGYVWLTSKEQRLWNQTIWLCHSPFHILWTKDWASQAPVPHMQMGIIKPISDDFKKTEQKAEFPSAIHHESNKTKDIRFLLILFLMTISLSCFFY